MTRRGHSGDAIDRHVGRQLRLLREERGLSGERLAQRLGLSSAILQRCETGESRIGAADLARAARALDVPVQRFFDGLAPAQHDLPTPPCDGEVPAHLRDPALAREAAALAADFSRLPESEQRNLAAVVRAIAHSKANTRR